jgi:hypothetical protein
MLVRGRAGGLAGAVSSPTAISSTRFCRAAVVIAAVSGFVGMATFSPLSYCRVSSTFLRRDRVVTSFYVRGMFHVRKENRYGTSSLKSNVPVDKRG